MSQTSFSDNPAAGFAGLIADTGFRDVISAIAATRQLEQVVVTTADDSQNFTVTINGTAFVYASDTSATKTEIRDGLKVLIDAGSEPVSTESVSTDTLYIESTDYDTGFTLAVAAGGSGVLTATNLVAQEQAIEFGKVVVLDERADVNALTGKDEACRLPRLAADITGGKTLGIAIADTSKVTRSTSPENGYSAGEAVPIIRKGRVWVEVEDVASVARGGSVYVRHVATGSEELGAIRAVDDGSDTDPIPNGAAQFTGQVSGSLAVVELNLP